jgi:hypothetical protein
MKIARNIVALITVITLVSGAFAEPGKTAVAPKSQAMEQGKMEQTKMNMQKYPMMDSCSMKGMMKHNMMRPLTALSGEDGAIIIIKGNKIYKYDKELNLVKTAELPVDSIDMNKMPNCMSAPMSKPKSDSSKK